MSILVGGCGSNYFSIINNENVNRQINNANSKSGQNNSKPMPSINFDRGFATVFGSNGGLSNLSELTLDEAVKLEWIKDTWSDNAEEELKGMGYEDYLLHRNKKLKAKKFDFSALEESLGLNSRNIALEISENTYAANYGYNDFFYGLNYTAASYAVNYNNIVSNYSGNELEENISRLNEIYKNKIDIEAEKYATYLDNLLSDFEVKGEKDSVYQSIKTAFTQKSAEYVEFINKNSDYANISGTDYEWLAQNSKFMATSLREVYAENISDKIDATDNISKLGNTKKEMAEYSLDELYFLTESLNGYKTSIKNAQPLSE